MTDNKQTWFKSCLDVYRKFLSKDQNLEQGVVKSGNGESNNRQPQPE
jgi:hypothetical protein